MEKIVGIKFKQTNKVYYFSPNNIELKKDDLVVVETAKGLEMGKIAFEEREMTKEINLEIKPIIRKATEEDISASERSRDEKERDLSICQMHIDKNELDMKLIDVEYTLDSSKIIFYFTSDGRVDFRELVKDLAAVFKMRIELRQIGVRDEAKMIGGIGSCGRSLCCSKWLSDFQPVSIKMAKTQGLSLNPSKISGICGRLMCCLSYENDNYVESKKGMPEIGEKIMTPDGEATVLEVRVLENDIKVRLEIENNGKGAKTQVEIKNFKKEDIKLIRKKRCCCSNNEELTEDVKELLKD